jgi:hypothetical protein
MLLDDEIRQDTVALPLSTVSYIIGRFQVGLGSRRTPSPCPMPSCRMPSFVMERTQTLCPYYHSGAPPLCPPPPNHPTPQNPPPTPTPTPPHPPPPQPDDYAPDGIPPHVLAALLRAAKAAGVDPNRPPALEVEAECTYYSPTDDMVMEKVRGACLHCAFKWCLAVFVRLALGLERIQWSEDAVA